jgi:subtilase family serine protease
LLNQGDDGRGETVTILAPAPSSSTPAGLAPPVTSDIRQDLASFDRVFGLPAARIQVVTALAGSASPWQVPQEEVADAEVVHAVAPAATLRVVRMPASTLDSAADATTDLLAGLRLAVSGTDVALISGGLGEHFFAAGQVAQLNAILRGAAAHHVTVVASSGDNGSASDAWFGETLVKEVSLPASDPLVLAVGGTILTASPATGAYRGETGWNGNTGSFSVSPGASGGGFSHLYARPAYQDGVPGIGVARGVPDVAGDAFDLGGWPAVLTRRPPDNDQHRLGRQRRRVAVGGADGAGRPGRPARPGDRQPRDLPHRPRLRLPPGLSRCHRR